ncbi:unnamed protein product [Ranitomeya imitator]|uniref:Ig-like domain-containing protein n=1 Tax=Ranitomeya imitator TaxID=111125 RepID=A0ABN9LX20_9NEOB|nr:unnamed protein product [Ranitomeya imitator]
MEGRDPEEESTVVSDVQQMVCCSMVKVEQYETLRIVKSGDKLELRCKQDQNDYLSMYWYQQKPGQGLKLMVYSTGANAEDMEADYKQRWSLKRPTVYESNLTLAVSAREDGAVYFCAASMHSRRGLSPGW